MLSAMHLLRSTLALCLCVTPLLPAQTASTAGVNSTVLQQIPQRMREFVDRGTVAGIVTLVADREKVLEFDAVGMADREANRPMRKDTIFQIMSMTKPITAVGIMMLADEGKLSLRDPVELYLPEFHDLRVVTNVGPDAGRNSLPVHPITIVDLMTHTAGIRDPALAPLDTYTWKLDKPLEEVVRGLAKQPLLFQPGTAWSYSSPGIEILGRIIEVVSHQKYEDFIAERILRPLGMNDSFFYPPADKIDRIAMVYAQRDGKLVRSPATILGGDPSLHRKGSVFPAPGWGLYSTAADLLRFYRMMLGDGVFEGRRYLSPFSVHLMTQPFTSRIRPAGWMVGSDYGLAWEIATEPMGEAAGHAKGTYGHGGAFGTQGWIDPEHQLIRILLVQRSEGGPDGDTLRAVFLHMGEAAIGK